MTSTVPIPQDEGRLSPREVEAMQRASQIDSENLAGHKEIGPAGLKLVQNILQEWTDQMRPLFRRWRMTHYMLQGNTLERSGPEDVHVPEIYKAVETLVPRIEEAIVELDPWFRIKARRLRDQSRAKTNEAYLDFLFDQARVRRTIQPAARNMLICQAAAWYGQWHTKVQVGTIREEVKEKKNGRTIRKVKKRTGKQVTYFGPKASLIDPFDFIIDVKATNAQEAVYVGHRAWLTVDEIRRLGKQFGWKNLGQELDDVSGMRDASSTNWYSWPRDPTSPASIESLQNVSKDGRPGKIEVTIIYSKYDPHGTGDYRDYQFVVSAGKVIHEIRLNQHDDERRPYATARCSSNGHQFYGTGPLDNAIRLNQHLDRYHQIFLRAAEVAACPMVFAEEDSDLPDSLYKMEPFRVFKGVGNVRFSNVPDGVLNAAPMVLNTITRNIEETTGAFKIQMGQDLTGGTATEATLSLQEGNRRTRALIRGMAEGLEQLLEMFYYMARQHSVEDIEFPVLGKRAIDLKRSHARVSPADLLGDVQFDLIGLHSLRTNGIKGTGLQMFGNTMAPFIMANPGVVDQPRLMHAFASEFIGDEMADLLVRVPTPPNELRSQEEENEGLIQGTIIEVDQDDDHVGHLRELEPLFQRAMHQKDMDLEVRIAIVQHHQDHLYHAQRQRAQQKAMEQRAARNPLPPEAGGQVGLTGQSPKAGGMSDAMTQLSASPGGQVPGETPGPQDPMKGGRAGRASRPMSQSNNQVGDGG